MAPQVGVDVVGRKRHGATQGLLRLLCSTLRALRFSQPIVGTDQRAVGIQQALEGLLRLAELFFYVLHLAQPQAGPRHLARFQHTVVDLRSGIVIAGLEIHFGLELY